MTRDNRRSLWLLL